MQTKTHQNDDQRLARCALAQAILNNALEKIASLKVTVRHHISSGGNGNTWRNVLPERLLCCPTETCSRAGEKNFIRDNHAGREPRTRLATAGATSSGVLALCGFIALLACTVALAQIKLNLSTYAPDVPGTAAVDLLEVRPAYWLQCPEPACENTNSMPPLHWWHCGSDTCHIMVQYCCTNCGLEFFIRKAHALK